MALFSTRERTAIAAVCVLIVIGWAVRYALYRQQSVDDIRIIRNAVPVPETLTATEKATLVLVDINSASASEFETLPGIGPAKAAAIVQYRNRHGKFAKVSDLEKVPGIGPATLEALAPYITLSDSVTPMKAKADSVR